MDKQAYLTILLSGQIALVAMDIRQSVVSGRSGPAASRLKPRTILFLGGTIAVYGLLQFGGLALVPNFEQLLPGMQTLANRIVATGIHALPADSVAVTLVAVFGFYFAGLCDYLFHRFASHSKWLWFTHENHHLPVNVSAYMPGLCVRPFAVVSVFPTTALTILMVQLVFSALGRTPADMMPMVYTVVLVHATILGVSHSAFLRRFDWLHDLLKMPGITTPQDHWLHHTSDLECNYGNIVTVWDRVFGTYVDPRDIAVDTHRAGLAYDQDFLGTITLGRFKLPQRVRQTLQLDRFSFLQSPDQSPEVAAYAEQERT